jgi:hypothetical protein
MKGKTKKAAKVRTVSEFYPDPADRLAYNAKWRVRSKLYTFRRKHRDDKRTADGLLVNKTLRAEEAKLLRAADAASADLQRTQDFTPPVSENGKTFLRYPTPAAAIKAVSGKSKRKSAA